LPEDHIEKAAHIHARLLDAEDNVAEVRAERDQTICDAIAQGVSAYKNAQELGISEAAVAKIKKAGKT
jgi:DNA-binding NarL/FixJ family response regulator